MDYTKELHEMCEVLSRELGEANEKIRSAGGKLSGSDLDYVDKLTHALKSIKTTIAMVEAEDDGESGYYMPQYGAYTGGGSYNRGRYYARGGQRRDSMGRYSRRGGMSYDDGMVEELRELMEQAPDERTKQEFRHFISKIEGMM